MPYNPNQPAQTSIQAGGKRYLIQDGVEYTFHPPHAPLDPAKAAKREAELEAQRAASATPIVLYEGEDVVAIDRGYYVIEGPNGERGPFRKSQVQHLLPGAPVPAASTAQAVQRTVGDPLTLKEGERLDERGSGWYAVVNAAGEQVGPALRRDKVEHLIGAA